MTLIRSRSGAPLWVGWTKEFRTLLLKDDPVRHGWKNQVITFRGTLGGASYVQSSKVALLLEQKKVIEQIAELGRNCIIVG